MPIYSLTYLNTSTMELNPHLYHCVGACILRSNPGCQEHMSSNPAEGMGTPGVLGVLSRPLLGAEGVSSTRLYIKVIHRSQVVHWGLCVRLCVCSTFLPYVISLMVTLFI